MLFLEKIWEFFGEGEDLEVKGGVHLPGVHSISRDWRGAGRVRGSLCCELGDLRNGLGCGCTTGLRELGAQIREGGRETVGWMVFGAGLAS